MSVFNEVIKIISSKVREAKEKLLTEESGREVASLQGHVSGWGQHWISIGCHQHSLRLWQEKFRDIGEREDYTEVQIEEYKGYIDMLAALPLTAVVESGPQVTPQ